jgi:general secretion pathway protein A
MYNDSFGLGKNPFNMTPDPAFLFLTAQHREALVGLTYGILQRKGFVVLTGEAGTGKTTLIARVLQSLPSNKIQFSAIINPTLTPAEFLESVLLDFGMTNIQTSKAQRLWMLRRFLLQGQREGKISALIIDEAHKLSPEVLEEIRLLGNFEEADQKFLQILLVGQGELDDLLNRDDLRQFRQRVAVRLFLSPLAPTDVAQYIRHRWLRAGGTDAPFSSESINCIADASDGIPRVINALCDNALTLAYAEGASLVEARHVTTASTDLVRQEIPRREVPADLPIPEPTRVDGLNHFEHRNGASAIFTRWRKWTGRLGLPQRQESHE